jgi:hypothetical protein
MTTQYTPILKLALPVQGELSGTWGDVVNDNITSMVEQAIAGLSVVNTWTTNSHVLTTANGTTAESRAAMLSLTDSGTALTGAGSVICPALSKVYIVKNGTAQVITVKTAAGSGIAVPVGKTMLVYCDGTNVLEAVDHVVTLSAGTLTITGLTTFASLKGTGAVTVTNILDEDNMASDSATALATQQSIKAYVDSQVGTVDTLSEILAIGNTSGANNLIIDNGQAITTNTINETTAASGVTIDSVLLKDDGVNATNLEITNLKANDGTSAGSIADSTGVVTLASSVLTTADINGGTIDGTTLGATTPASVAATTGSFSSTLGVTGAATFSSTVAGAFNGTLGATTPASVAATTLSTTGIATFGGNVTGKNATFVTTTAASLITIGDAAAGTYSLLRMYGGSGKYNFQVGVQNNVNNAFEITPSTAVGGTTFTTPALLIDGTTGAATFSSTLSVGNIATFTNDNQYLVFNRPTTGDFAYIGTASNTTGGPATDLGIRAENNLILGAGGYGADLTIASTGAATFSGNVVGLTFESSVSSSSTNLATNSGGSLTLKNTSVTDGNFSNIGGYNSNTLVTSQINFVNVSQASRTGAITFNVHNGTSMPEVGRFDASGNLGIGTDSPTYKLNVLSDAGAQNIFQAGQSGVSNGLSITSDGSALTYSFLSGNVGIGTNSPVVRLNPVVSYVASTIIPAIKLATVGGYNSGSGAAIDFGQNQDTYATWVTGRIASPRTGNNWGGSLTFSTNDNSAEAALVERMTLDASGSVGIGVVPSAWGGTQKSLQLPGNSVFAGGNDVGTIVGNNMYWDGSAYKYIATAAANMLQFSAGSYLFRQALSGTAGNPITFTTAMTLDASGDVGIGLTNGNHRLQVLNDKANFAVTKFTSTSAATTEYGISLNLTNDPNDATRYFLYCAGGVTGRAIIYANGNIANTNNSYTAISDLKLKENIVDAGSQWDDIKALRVRKYSFKEENASEPTQIGVIAQEVEAAGMSGLVYETADQDTAEDGSFVDTGEVTKIMKYSILYMKAVKALQEAMERIESLETRIEALEGAK